MCIIFFLNDLTSNDNRFYVILLVIHEIPLPYNLYIILCYFHVLVHYYSIRYIERRTSLFYVNFFRDPYCIRYWYEHDEYIQQNERLLLLFIRLLFTINYC